MADFFNLTFDNKSALVNIEGITRDSISLVNGFNICEFDVISQEDFVAYEIQVVPNQDSIKDEGTVIGTENGSVNMSGTGTFNANESLHCTINALDIKAIIDNDITYTDKDYVEMIIKVFVQDSNGNWS